MPIFLEIMFYVLPILLGFPALQIGWRANSFNWLKADLR